jgi:DNA-binding transcriptional ArsR family regulator
MYFCYIDESGNTGNNLVDPHQPLLVLTGLLVPPDRIKEIENAVRDLGFQYFGAESRNTDFEFHGDALYQGNRKRDRYFKKLPLAKRLEILSALVEIVLGEPTVKIGYVSIEKSKYYATPHIQQTAFSLLTEKLEEHLKGHLDSYCLLIADEQDEIEQKLIDDLDHFKQHGTSFGYKSVTIDRIIDSVHFVQSHNNYLMQLADVLCYVTRRGKEANNKLFRRYMDDEIREKDSISFQEWLEQSAHRGQKYFYDIYNEVRKRKGWLFTKNFP